MVRIPFPTFKEELLLWSKGLSHVAGIDEVGRGAFAGPVVAAAVIFPKHCTFINPLLHTIHDSKLLTHKKRVELAILIKEVATSYAISEIPLKTINEQGIGKATQKAFYKAVSSLATPAEYFLIDAFYIDGLSKEKQKPLIHGDYLSISIAAASIIAKVYRDELMEKLHDEYPMYDFKKNKGYGTKYHRDQIQEHGLSPLHRTSFNLTPFLS